MSSRNLKFAEVLLTKICHDLSGSIGAINNGIELLFESYGSSQALELSSLSSREAVAKLIYLRYAFGVGNANFIDKNNFQNVVKDYLQTYNIEFLYKEKEDVPISSLYSKILLNVIIISSKTLIRGGKVFLTINSKEKAVIEISGASILRNDKLAEFFLNDTDENNLDVKSIGKLYLLELMEEAGFKGNLIDYGEKIVFEIAKE